MVALVKIYWPVFIELKKKKKEEGEKEEEEGSLKFLARLRLVQRGCKQS